ncbi:Cleavage and polyadenylation specificity factor 2 [Klebsormidium nitens]|uniref:Cleavage and polyadenylation specificity factor subunit 2 n=1 Tax=Klebsormidium nitens TaxID=105231 RepID=A0A1Y1IKJ8_KLENI|nr:Cleavage and polyadenylation specificity factor 2 [Klebsormidium nitens]|eukprot:GAQ90662.1 Cleavage and polyadenylation specificity factor 2 [Klebsormidium nitens]
MGTAVRFMPLCGVLSEDPLCYLLQVDNFSILLDCGWNDSFDPVLLENVKSHISDIDAVLLSHPDTSHLGALPYLMGKLGLAAPVYATLPVAKLGHLYMYDHVLSRQAVSDFDTFDLDDVDFAFNSMETIKYAENRVLSGKGAGITISAHAAGHLVGGTLWKISKDGEDIIYAVDYNHRKERHLNGTVLLNFVRPAVLITDAYNALSVQTPQKQRDQEFLEAVQGTLRTGGSVLVPVDTAGRVLEVLLCLEHYWGSNRAYQGFPVALLTSVSYNVVDFAKSSLEWMAENIGKHFERARANAFDLRHTTLCHSLEDLAALAHGPKVVLASMGSLETGFSRLLLEEWTEQPGNLIIFPERGQPSSLARFLQQVPTPPRVSLTLSEKIPLEGEELEKHRQEQALLQKQKLEEETRAREQLGAVKAEEEERVAELEAAQDAGPSGASLQVAAEPGGGPVPPVPAESAKRKVFIDGFELPPGAVHPMFPDAEEPKEWDEYGEVIDPDEYRQKEDDPMDLGRNLAEAQGGRAAAPEPEAVPEEDPMLIDDRPSKVVTKQVELDVRCKVRYVDMEGRPDGRSMKNIIEHVAPIKTILVHGTREATENLRRFCESKSGASVHTPDVNQWVDVSSAVGAYRVKLTEEMMSGVTFRKMGDYEVGWVDSQVGPPETQEQTTEYGAVEKSQLLPLLPLRGGDAPGHKAVLVGEVKLSDFRQVLASAGVPARFADGALHCGKHVVVRKVAQQQQLVIEGALSEDYYKVRDLLYSQFYIV